MNIGSKIKDLRKQGRWTQTAFAKEAGISREGLYKIEEGISEPSITTLTAIAEALGVEITDFFPKNEDLSKQEKASA